MPTGRKICLHLTHSQTNAPTPGSQTTPSPAVVFLLNAIKELHCRASACATSVQETARRCHDFRFDRPRKKPSSSVSVSLRISVHPLCSQIKEQLLHLNLRCTGRKRFHQAVSLSECLQPNYIHIYHH